MTRQVWLGGDGKSRLVGVWQACTARSGVVLRRDGRGAWRGSFGWVWQASHGKATKASCVAAGGVGLVSESQRGLRQGRHGVARSGLVRRGGVSQGGHAEAWQARRVPSGPVLASHGRRAEAGLGTARTGMAWFGRRGLVAHGTVSSGEVGRGTSWQACRGLSRWAS